MKYQSELIKEIIDTRGHEKSSLHYQSECVETWIEENKGSYPKLCDYESEWVYYINENPLGEFPYETITNVTEATVNNVVPFAYKSAILSGNTLVNLCDKTKSVYSADENKNMWKNVLFNTNPTQLTVINLTDKVIKCALHNRTTDNWVSTIVVEANSKSLLNCGTNNYLKDLYGAYSDGWSNTEEDRNILKDGILILEGDHTQEDIPYFEGMQSVKMPVLTTSNEDGTKTIILSTSEDVELRGIGDVKDELNLLTGEVVERIGEIVLDGSQTLQPHSTVQGDTLMIKISDPSISFKQNSNLQESWDFSDMICDKELIAETKKWNANEWNEGYNIALISSASSNIYNINSFVLAIRKSYFNVQSIAEFKTWLTQNPLTIQYKLAKESIKTVDLIVTNQDGESLTKIIPIEGTMNISTDGTPIKPTITMEIPVEAIAQNLASFIEEE